LKVERKIFSAPDLALVAAMERLGESGEGESVKSKGMEW
jgi:hypothetical protein